MSPAGQSVFRMHQILNRRANTPQQDIEVTDATSNGHGSHPPKEEQGEEEEEAPQLSIYGALALLVGITIITALTAEYLVSCSCVDFRIPADQ